MERAVAESFNVVEVLMRMHRNRSALVAILALALAATPAAGQKKVQQKYEVTVKVADKPVSGVALQLVSTTDSSPVRATDAQGRVAFQMPSGKYRLLGSTPAAHLGWKFIWDIPIEVRPGLLGRLQNKMEVTEGDASFADSIPAAARSVVVSVLGGAGAGSGVVLTRTGVIATAFPLVASPAVPLVQLDSMTKVRARILMIDSAGFALIKVSDESCRGCVPLSRQDTTVRWQKRDILRLVRGDPVFGHEDAVATVAVASPIAARTEPQGRAGFLGAAVLGAGGDIEGLVVSEELKVSGSDTVKTARTVTRNQTVHPIRRAWEYLARVDTVDAARTTDTLYPVAPEPTMSLAEARRATADSADSRNEPLGKLSDVWARTDSLYRWKLTVIGPRALAALRYAGPHRLMSIDDAARATALRDAFDTWWSWRSYAESDAPVVVLAVTPYVDVGLVSSMISTVILGSKAKKRLGCAQQYRSSIANINLMRDSVEVLPLERARVGLPKYFPGTELCVENAIEKQVLAVFPVDALAPSASGRWPRITIQADDNKKGTRGWITLPEDLLREIWRDLSLSAR